MKALIDSNIMLDILLKRNFNQDALELLRVMQNFGDVDLWVSAKSCADNYYFLDKYLGSDAAHDALEGALDWVNVCSLGGSDIRLGIERHWSDLEDCLINVSAEKIKADYLITRDEKGFAKAKIPHGNAEEFMAYVAETMHLEYAIEDLLEGYVGPKPEEYDWGAPTGKEVW